MSERSECRLTSTDLIRDAEKHNFEGGWGLVAVSAAIFEVAGALWDLRDFLGYAYGRLEEPRPTARKGR